MRPMIGIAVLGACIAIAGCNQAPSGNLPANNATSAGDNNVGTGNVTNPPLTATTSLAAQDFANLLAAGDAFEIATSRLALTQAPTPAVKEFARKMIDAHTTSTDKLRQDTAAHQPAITPDQTLSADQQQKLDGLKTLTGSAFERIYLADQIAAHEAALSAVQAYSQSGDVPFLRDFATNAVAMVSDHLMLARQLNAVPPVS